MGVYHSPEAILQVTDSHGKPLYVTHPDQRARLAIDPAVAFIMAQIMADDQNRCMIFGCNSALHWKDRIVAAKTGTTDNFKDAVTIAFTPDLATGLWVGDIKDNRFTMIAGSDGVFVASPGVHEFVSRALAGVDGNRWYTPPPGVVSGPGNSWYLVDTTHIDSCLATTRQARRPARRSTSCRPIPAVPCSRARARRRRCVRLRSRRSRPRPADLI